MSSQSASVRLYVRHLDPSLKVERTLVKLQPGVYRGRGRAYGFCLFIDVEIWKVEPHWGDIPERAEYAAWLIEHYMGLSGPHESLRAAREMLIDALRADLSGEVED